MTKKFDKDALATALLHADKETLDDIHKNLKTIRQGVADMNSMFPATKEYLATRGLEHIDQLDDSGLKELRIHLERTLSNLTPNKA